MDTIVYPTTQDIDDLYVVNSIVNPIDVAKYGPHPAIRDNWPIPTKAANRIQHHFGVVMDFDIMQAQSDKAFEELSRAQDERYAAEAYGIHSSVHAQLMHSIDEYILQMGNID